MKAIILAAWEWTRLRPLTNTTPKPLIKICGKSIIEHNLENIYKHVSEIIIVVKYKKEVFFEKLWDNYKNCKITYHEQSDDKWTWAAIRWIKINCHPELNSGSIERKNINSKIDSESSSEWQEDILILNWDSIFDKADLEEIIKLSWYWCLVQEVEDPSKYGIFKEKESYALEIVEKPSENIWNLANLWVYKFSTEIFNIVENIELSSRWEYEITDAINTFIELNKFKLISISWEFIDVWYPWDILTANQHFLNKLSISDIKWTIEDWVSIKWNIVLEEGSILKSGTYIEWNIYIWKNTSIGPNIYLRWSTVIWDNCHLGNAVEIKNSAIWDNTNVWHLSYIWDSVIWNHVNFWAWFITANLRHDSWNVKVPIKWVLTDTGRRKLWVIIWDNTKTGIKSMAYPWRVLENDSFTLPWTIIK